MHTIAGNHVIKSFNVSYYINQIKILIAQQKTINKYKYIDKCVKKLIL